MSSGQLARAVDLGGARGDDLVGEDPDGVAEQDLLLGQARGPGDGCGAAHPADASSA